MIAVVDYRAGNLTSVMAALNALGAEAQVTASAAVLRRADRVIFPGVGAAGESMANLQDLDLTRALRETVQAGTPFMGICVGFQLLFESSEEDGGTDCLAILPGPVVRFPENMREEGQENPLKIPHMGWNGVTFTMDHPVTRGIEPASEFYFVHSYYPRPPADTVCARTHYGIDFASGAAAGNIIAFQFHPEKSGRPGLQLLRNFCSWTPDSAQTS